MNWTPTTLNDLKAKFGGITSSLATRMNQIARGKTAPSIDNLPIASAKEVRTAVMFFDIVGFTKREGTESPEALQRTLWTLNCVIPMMMHVIHECGGYVEKNTGDGLMALFDAEDGEDKAAIAAVDAAITCLYVLKQIINPHLVSKGIEPVHARIGIDQGLLLISRIGVATGSSDHQRNFLTAVGATANIACRLQQNADEDGILIGENVRRHLPSWRLHYAQPATYGSGWHYVQSGQPYLAWRFTEVQTAPLTDADVAAILASLSPAAPSFSLAGLGAPPAKPIGLLSLAELAKGTRR